MSGSISVTLIRNLNHKDSRTTVIRPPSLEPTAPSDSVPDSPTQFPAFENVLHGLLLEASANKFKLRARDIVLYDSCGTLIRPPESSGSTKSKSVKSCQSQRTSTSKQTANPSNQSVHTAEIGSTPYSEQPTILPSSAVRSGAKIYVSAGENWIPGKATGGSKWSQPVLLGDEKALPGVFLAVGLPDLHAGPTCPIGTAVATSSLLYPALVGSDIGCGIRFDATSLTVAAAERSRVVERWANAVDLEGGWEGDVGAYLHAAGVPPTRFDKSSLGTVGKGNHFAELQSIESIEDPIAAEALGLDPSSLYLCVHSGSRGVGESVLEEHRRRFGHAGIDAASPEGSRYLTHHDHACEWAAVNRRLISERFLAQLCAESVRPILDVCHNHVVETTWGGGDRREMRKTPLQSNPKRWLHRKGAAPSDRGPVVIPGSRGAFSYLVMPLETGRGGTERGGEAGGHGAAGGGSGDTDGGYRNGWSLAHGAGRKVGRSTALAAGKSKYPHVKELNATAIGSRVVCEDKELIYEEVPEAYKEIGCVIADLVEAGLCRVVAVLRPVLSYKTRAKSWG